MLVSIAQNCTKSISDLSVKKHLVLVFVGFRKMYFFFEFLDLPIFNINRLSYISQAKSMLRLFKCFFNKNFKWFFGNSRFEHSVPKKNFKKMSHLLSFLWVLSLKNKVFRAKFFRIRLIQRLGVSFDCSNLYKTHF